MIPEQPVSLVPSRHSEWAKMADEMMEKIHEQVSGAHLEHIGSTAVPGLPAKDVVDLLVGVESDRVLAVAQQLASVGFDLEGELDHHSWLSFPTRSARAYVIHVVEHESRPWHRRISFRDLLRSDENARAEYLQTKIDAAHSAKNWDDYTQSKSSVVANLLTASGSK